MTAYKFKDRVLVRYWSLDGTECFEPATVMRWQKYMGKREDMPGYVPLKYWDGKSNMCHVEHLKRAN